MGLEEALSKAQKSMEAKEQGRWKGIRQTIKRRAESLDSGLGFEAIYFPLEKADDFFFFYVVFSFFLFSTLYFCPIDVECQRQKFRRCKVDFNSLLYIGFRVVIG